MSDDEVVADIRILIARPDIQNALKHGNDNVCAFALRAVHRFVSELEVPSRVIINRLWDILDQPNLNRALHIEQNSRMKLGLKKPPAG
jgi:hypothetical protein